MDELKTKGRLIWLIVSLNCIKKEVWANFS